MDNKPGKRKSRMNNIQSRLNSSLYDMSKFKANEKDLREKVAFFEKKEAKGELKDYMYFRMEEAKEMYAKLMALKSGAPTAAPTAAAAAAGGTTAAASPLAQSSNTNAPFVEPTAAAAANTLSSAPAKTRRKSTPPKMTLKKLNKQRREAEATALAASYAQPQFNPPPRSPVALPQPYGQYNRDGQFHVTGAVAPQTSYNLGGNAAGAGGYGTAFNNLAAYQTAVAAVTGRVPKATSTRRQRTPVSVYNEYYAQAVPMFLPLPELYDPYTGRKFAPEEDPMPPIESAYHELKGILKKAHLKAASLRKKAARASKRKSKKSRNKSTANTYVLPPTVPSVSTYASPKVVGANQPYISKFHPSNFTPYQPYQPHQAYKLY